MRHDATLLDGEKPVHPFHWEIEFPEVFDRENPGFDAIVGNPPFAGKNTMVGGHRREAISTGSRRSTRNRTATPTSSPTSSAARSTCCATGGTFGLIATNTIGQGDTRIDRPALDLHPRRDDLRSDPAQEVAGTGGRGRQRGPRHARASSDRHHPYLDSTAASSRHHRLPVPRRRPRRPRPTSSATQARAFQGSIVFGMGFTFDDTDTKGVATPIAEMNELIAKDPRNARADLSLHRRRGSQRLADARPSPRTSSTSAR